LWEGWIEFIAVDDEHVLRTSRETTQPNRVDALYWASGLTRTYLEGALDRAAHHIERIKTAAARPVFREPAPHVRTGPGAGPARQAILDPFSVYGKGEAILRQELAALSRWHLANIAIGYQLTDRADAEVEVMPAADLVELIVDAERARLSHLRREA